MLQFNICLLLCVNFRRVCVFYVIWEIEKRKALENSFYFVLYRCVLMLLCLLSRLYRFDCFCFDIGFRVLLLRTAGDVAICHLCLLLPLLPCQLFHSIVRVAKASAGNWVLLRYQLQLLQLRSAAAAAYVINNQHVSVSDGVMLERRC